MNKNHKIAIIGLGYVGLPLAIEFSKQYKTFGFDINSMRVDELKNGIDVTNEANLEDLKNQFKQGLEIVNTLDSIKNCNIYIVTVPTPITSFKTPDLSFLKSASKTVGEILKKGDIVIYESTVYPGCTEEDCVPELEKASGLISQNWRKYVPNQNKDHQISRSRFDDFMSCPKCFYLQNIKGLVPSSTPPWRLNSLTDTFDSISALSID